MTRREDLLTTTPDWLEPYHGPIREVRGELEHAVATYAAMHSPHEGYAVLLEELDELWEVVRRYKPPGHPAHSPKDYYAMRREACQVAAMALRFMVDVTEEPRK